MPEASGEWAAPAAARLASGLAGLSLTLDAGATQRLLDYLALLERWNRVYNLTAVRDPLEMVPRHLLDSLAVLPWVEGARLLDVGTGAGLPGIVLAIARPGLDVVLLDASAKRTRFCIQAASELGLDNVGVVHARVEAHQDARGFCCIISRAVGPVVDLVARSRHLLAPGGAIIAMKGKDPTEEIQALAPPGSSQVVALAVPGLGAPRHLVRWRP